LLLNTAESAAFEDLISVVLEIRNLFSTESLAFPGEIKIPKQRWPVRIPKVVVPKVSRCARLHTADIIQLRPHRDRERKYKMKTVVKPTEMRADIEMTHKNVFLVLQYSVVTVSLEVPDDEDEYDYDSITEAAAQILADDLGLSVSLVKSYVQYVEVEN